MSNINFNNNSQKFTSHLPENLVPSSPTQTPNNITVQNNFNLIINGSDHNNDKIALKNVNNN